MFVSSMKLPEKVSALVWISMAKKKGSCLCLKVLAYRLFEALDLHP